MTEANQSKGRVRRWLDRRRDAQRRAAAMAQRAKAARREDAQRGSRHGNVGSGDPGQFGGG